MALLILQYAYKFHEPERQSEDKDRKTAPQQLTLEKACD